MSNERLAPLCVVPRIGANIMPDTTFSGKEIGYVRSQHLARIASAASSMKGSIQPDVVPVGFDYDGEYFYVGGMNLLKSTKYKNVQKNPKIAFVVDDLKSVNPWESRGIRIYGIGDIVTRQGGYICNKLIIHRKAIFV
jgi:pyridoxamine 5'-phosphate oxidase family protein